MVMYCRFSVHVVFGAVVSGQALVRQVEMLPVDRNARPLQDAVVTNCGQLVKLTKGNKHHSQTSSTRRVDINNRNLGIYGMEACRL